MLKRKLNSIPTGYEYCIEKYYWWWRPEWEALLKKKFKKKIGSAILCVSDYTHPDYSGYAAYYYELYKRKMGSYYWGSPWITLPSEKRYALLAIYDSADFKNPELAWLKAYLQISNFLHRILIELPCPSTLIKAELWRQAASDISQKLDEFAGEAIKELQGSSKKHYSNVNLNNCTNNRFEKHAKNT